MVEWWSGFPIFSLFGTFTTAVYGVHCPGTAHRMDKIPIPLRTILPTHSPTDDDALSKIVQRIVHESSE